MMENELNMNEEELQPTQDDNGHVRATPPEVILPNDRGNYQSDNVKVFRDAEHIRERPGMYIGDTGIKGLHHLVYELIYNSVDEALAGHCSKIQVKINKEGSISVSDDGRGIPVDEHPVEKKPTLEVVMTTVGAGAKFDHDTYKVSAGLHGIGAKAVTALSDWAEAEVKREGKVYVQEYERGQPLTEVKVKGEAHRTGTKITFRPDPEIFGDTPFHFPTLEHRLRELAFLNKGLRFILADERDGKEEEFHYEGGIAEFVEHLNRDDEVLHPVIYIDETREDVRVEVAFQYVLSNLNERTSCYANNAFNVDGGTHRSGFRLALTRSLKAYGSQEKLFRNIDPRGEDFREGLTAVISVQVPDPQLEAQTKVRLNNPEVEGIVSGVVGDYLKTWLEEHPKEAKLLMQKVTQAAEAREAASKAAKALRERKSILSGGGLPGKLMDCTNPNRDESELFLVEGQSAGGSAESGRDRQYQAILPMRGKVLNVEKHRAEKLLNNEEICSLISAVGIDIGNTEELDNLRYNKIVILTDADVDGQHIRTLLLTFFYRQMGRLVENGNIYVARPPLYKVTQKKKVRYINDNDDMIRQLIDRGLDGTKLSIFNTETNEEVLAVEGEELNKLLAILTPMESAILVLERRGIDLAMFVNEATEKGLPLYRVTYMGQQSYFATEEEAQAFCDEKGLHVKTSVEQEEEESESTESQEQDLTKIAEIHELHEVRRINRALDELKQWGLGVTDLIPQPRIAGREPDVRFTLTHGEQPRVLSHLRELMFDIRKLGERGLTVTRFKGLGEMDPEELWETTLDPERRTLMQVKLEDVIQADDMFRTLMGDKVEPRRDFIHEHALDVTDIDYHGA